MRCPKLKSLATKPLRAFSRAPWPSTPPWTSLRDRAASSAVETAVLVQSEGDCSRCFALAAERKVGSAPEIVRDICEHSWDSVVPFPSGIVYRRPIVDLAAAGHIAVAAAVVSLDPVAVGIVDHIAVLAVVAVLRTHFEVFDFVA